MMRVFMLLVLLGLSAGLLMAQPYIPPTPVVPSVGEPTPTLPPVYTLPCQLFDSDLSPELDRPWMHPELPCLEQIAADPSAGEWGYTGLAVADDGRLFAARPLTGEILMFTDTDGEGAPDSPRPIAAGLDQPWALDWHAGELYIRGARAVYVWTPDAIRVLVDDLPPAETGFPGGGIVVTDEAIYLPVGAPCDFCAFDQPERGAILRIDRADRRRTVSATGLRTGSDLVLHDGVLWFTDAARAGLFGIDALDEINRLELTAGPLDFGFPDCVGLARPDPALPEAACAGSVPAAFSLPTGSDPVALAWYTSDAIPYLTGKLLVALGGRIDAVDLRGFALIAIAPETGVIETLMPANASPEFNFSTRELNFRGSGFFPHRPLDLVVSADGWVYLSVGGGRILLIRPHIPQEQFLQAGT
ncbi:MAG: PQQ-dependent sugar dehydrogenase [Candidatus Flexifilum sp.]|jgi:glucose/arabinose dehydrogenase